MRISLKAAGCSSIGRWPASSTTSQAAPGKRVAQRLARGERDPRVLAPPDDERRHVQDVGDRLLELVATAVAEDRQQPEVPVDGLQRSGVAGEGGIVDPGGVGVGASQDVRHPGLVELRAEHELADPAHVGQAHEGPDGPEAPARRGRARRGVHEDDPVDPAGMSGGEPGRHVGAHAVPDERRRADAARVHDGRDEVGLAQHASSRGPTTCRRGRSWRGPGRAPGSPPPRGPASSPATTSWTRRSRGPGRPGARRGGRPPRPRSACRPRRRARRRGRGRPPPPRPAGPAGAGAG